MKWNEMTENWRSFFCYFILFYCGTKWLAQFLCNSFISFYFILLQMSEPLYRLWVAMLSGTNNIALDYPEVLIGDLRG